MKKREKNVETILLHVKWGGRKFTVSVDGSGVAVSRGHSKDPQEANSNVALWIDTFYLGNKDVDKKERDDLAIHSYAPRGAVCDDAPLITMKMSAQTGKFKSLLKHPDNV